MIKCVKCSNTNLIHRHHISDGIYFVMSGIIPESEYSSFSNIAPLCSTCHSFITSINSMFRKLWWESKNKWFKIQRTNIDYIELKNLHYILFNEFIKYNGDFILKRNRKNFVKHFMESKLICQKLTT